MDGEPVPGPSSRTRYTTSLRTTAIKRDSLMAELERGESSKLTSLELQEAIPFHDQILNLSIRPPTFSCKAATANTGLHLAIGARVS